MPTRIEYLAEQRILKDDVSDDSYVSYIHQQKVLVVEYDEKTGVPQNQRYEWRDIPIIPKSKLSENEH